MKKKYSLIATLVVVSVSVDGGMIFHSRSQEKSEEKKALHVGVSLYRGDGSFIDNLCGKMEEQAKAYEKTTGVRVILDVVDEEGNQNTRNSQMDRFVSLGVDVPYINMVDRSAASYIINRAIEGDIPMVLFNREPVERDMDRRKKLYYVRENARESAVLQGSILVNAYKKDPSVLDLSGDGKVNYVLLEGETSHQDSLIRTGWSIQTLKGGGMPLEKTTGGIGNWEQNQGSTRTERWLEEYPDEIELVISSNDDMALGAANALEWREITRPIKAVGINGTPRGMEDLTFEKLFGTVQCDNDEYADAVFHIATITEFGHSV